MVYSYSPGFIRSPGFIHCGQTLIPLLLYQSNPINEHATWAKSSYTLETRLQPNFFKTFFKHLISVAFQLFKKSNYSITHSQIYRKQTFIKPKHKIWYHPIFKRFTVFTPFDNTSFSTQMSPDMHYKGILIEKW